MKRKKAGTEFEELAKEIFDLIAKQETNSTIEGPKVFLEGKDGKREFDLTIRSTAVGLNFLTVVECRDHNKRLDVTHIDGFHSKMQDVLANKGVLISRRGFTKNAQKKANRLGISLYIGHDGRQISDDLCELGYGVSVVVYNINEIETGPINLKVHLEAGVAYPQNMQNQINDVSLLGNIQDALFNGMLKPEITEDFQIWDPTKYLNEVFVRDSSGKKVPVLSISVPVKILKMSTYWGYFHQLPNSRGILSLPEGKHDFVFRADDFLDKKYKNIFQQFDKLEDVPNSNLTVVVGEFDFEFNSSPEIRGPL